MSETYKISVEAPSNIAFIKYWGKKGMQQPINPSVSMTLKKCVTICHACYRKSEGRIELREYQFHGAENKAFEDRVAKYLNNLAKFYPSLNDLSLEIKTENNFPHSAGIASSASSFAAIGYALAYIEKNISNQGVENFSQRASCFARLGSGSAARSISGPYMIWGDCSAEESSDDYAVQLSDVHKDFHQVKDTILLINQEQKKYSSSKGHELMDDHPYRDSRIKQANSNAGELLKAMRTGDWEKFGDIIELEALTLHGLMMTSYPSYLLLEPQSIAVIQKIRAFRQESRFPVYFTIDAGPNIHLIYPKKYERKIEDFIKADLIRSCQIDEFIIDECGDGARICSE